MKSNVNKEDTDAKKKYVFFSDPDVVVRRAESTAAASQALQNYKIQEQLWRSDPKLTQSEPKSSANRETKSDLKGLETLLSYHPVQPYPFTFITAVKRKLALSMHAEACKRAYEPEKPEKVEAEADVNRSNTDFKRSVNQIAQKMDFIKPLKVPDLKISPKTTDYAQRDSLAPKDIVQPAGSLTSKKFDIHTLEDVALASNKSPKSCEKVHRKLDFSLLDDSAIKSCENVEPLKVPDLSIGSNLSKKKEHARDSSREKENRSKRIKKDDSVFGRRDDVLKETPRRSKLSKHLSRRDVDEESDSIFEMFRPEKFLTSAPRESDFGFKKPKSKNFLTSTVKKNDEKRQRSTSVQGARPGRERSSESKNINYDNDSNSEKSIKLHERITTRDSSRGKPTDNLEHGHKMLNQDLNTLKQGDDYKYKNTEPSGSKQKHSSKFLPQGPTKVLDNYSSKTQLKKSCDKQNTSANEPEAKELGAASDVSEEIRTASGSVASSKEAGNQCKIDVTSETDDSLGNEISLHQSKCNEGSREMEQPSRNSQSSSQTEKFHENREDVSHAEILSMGQGTNTDSRIIEVSNNQVDTKTSSSQDKSDSEYKNLQSKSLSINLDPNRISFRDESLDEQSEFCDLVTPDVNLLPRSKRRKNFLQEEEREMDSRSPKHQTANTDQSNDEGIKLLNPTALHLQFQAELHLLDSFNESLRQVMDVESSLYTAKHGQDQAFLRKQKENEIRRKNLVLIQSGRDTVDIERNQGSQSKNVQEAVKKSDSTPRHSNEEEEADIEATKTGNDIPNSESTRVLDRVQQSQNTIGDSDYALRKNDRISVRVTEVQTQTANDIATQTETPRVRRRHNSPGRQVSGITYQRGSPPIEEIPQLSLESFDKFEDFDQIENVSLPSRLHTMSEISLHETTSSIRTETGTEISISTRDVTCSFNKYLDSELAQLIKDEKQRYDEIEMLFKSREKTLNDRTKKLVKLEEQKRALRDMGQDSRISSVKKKQRALLLKLQQEKDEMNRLKELHKKASQERKLMLQKQRNMLNPQMSTKNILTKLKRSADSQSPRRLSGPMKGYDIRSPSSMSSLVDSDKSQLDRSHIETKTSLADFRLHKSEGRTPRSDIAFLQEGLDVKSLKACQLENTIEQSDISLIDSNLSPDSQKFINKLQRIQNETQKPDAKSKYEAKLCKQKDAMPKAQFLHHKLHSTDLESNTVNKKLIKPDASGSLERSRLKETQQKPVSRDLDKSISENIRSESDTLVDEFSKKSKSSLATEMNVDSLKLKREKETLVAKNVFDAEDRNTESDSIVEELSSTKSKSLQATEDISEMSSKNSKKTQNSSVVSKESCKKSQGTPKTKSNSKRKGSRCLKSKTSSDILSENILRSKSSSQISEEIMKHHSKRSKTEKDEAQSEENYRKSSMADELEANENQSSLHALVEHSKAVKEKNYQLLRNIANEHEENISRKDLENLPNVGNMSTRSQVSTLTISHHSSGESEKSYSRSVVIRAQDHHFRTTKKLEQILTAREAALASRRSCVEEWIAWHSRLRAEESRVARMEEAAFKLVSAASNALSYHDTTVSSDTSDVENRIEVLAEKLAERRTEMARLKREAKRQAKQRLKALETNLLNQIKKYDTTIHKMRKKLETKRGALFNDSSSDKLAIESKSLTDFKIPDIPIKRIKEIYQNSDLLKSRSESELRSLISEGNEGKEFENVYRNETSEHDNTSYRKSLKSPVSDITDRSEISNSDKKATTQSIQSIFEDVKTTTSKEADFISEHIESQSISEQIEANNYTSNGRSSSDKSEDEFSNTSLKSKSDQGGNEIENSHTKEITELDNEKSTPTSETRASIMLEGSRVSSNHEADSVLENIQLAGSVEIESESIETVPEVRLAKSSDVSIQESMSKFDPSEVIIEHNSSSAHAISDTNKDEDIPKSDTGESTSPKRVSPTIINLGIRSDVSASEIQYTLPEHASATEPSSAIDELDIENSAQKSPSISNKLSFLELGNKNLNDDISTLENDLQALSEMMSQFSKKSDRRLRSETISKNEDKSSNITANDSEKGTSEDMDMDYPNDVGEQQNMLNSNHNATYIVEEERDNSEMNEKDLTAQVTEIMLKIMPESAAPPQVLNEEIDFKARSREILNEIEKSIISEHVKLPESTETNLSRIETNISCLQDKNEEVVDDMNSLENDIMSIAEIISHASEAKKDIRMIERLGHDRLFEDEEPVELFPKSHNSTSEEPEILSRPTENDCFEAPTMNMLLDSNEEDNLQATDELKESLESLKKNLESINTRNAPRSLTETTATTIEQTDTMFETIKDPEYEDISEESLEVSEIMDRSESQRSDRQFYQKSSRLPEKYQMTQKSEDVLRILDEISQKSNDGSARSQLLLRTPGNDGRKIDELIQRSERLSQNFETLTKKPTQLDAAFDAPIAAPQKPSKGPILQQETLSQYPQKNLDEFVSSQPITTDDLSQELNEREPVYIAAEDQSSSNFDSQSSKSPIELLGFVKSPDEASEKSDSSSQRSDIDRQNINEDIQKSDTLNEKLVDKLYKSDERLQEAEDKSEVFDSDISDTGIPVFDENATTIKLVDEESEDKISLNSFKDQSKRSDKSTENSEDFIQTDGAGILSDKIIIITEVSEYQEAHEVSKDNSIGSETSNDEVLSGSDKELDKSNGYSYNIEAQIHESDNISISPSSEDNSIQKFEEELDAPESRRIVEETESSANTPEVISPDRIETLNKLEDSNVKLQHIDDTIQPFEDVLQKKEDSPGDSLHKINTAEKSSDYVSQKSDESQGSEKSEDILQKYEVELPSESGEDIDTPRSVSEIDMDSPRDPNDSRLDIDGLDDDLLANDNNFVTQNVKARAEFHAAPVVATSEKDIEAMIDKLKVSLEQPGLDVAELEAKLLRIQQLQIELEIKKLEAEEVSYYVREIPNKPPPPYTPPSGGRLSVSQTSPSPAPAVVPTNVEDLTSFTERATHLIYQAKQSGDDIVNLEPPIEICELSKDNNETSRRDRKIYNTFLFDLCKETISEVYQSEYEKPGPSWLKPNAKTKPTMKIPKTVEGLNDYVSKEVATLFGFKTKLQRENLVMRWSRKRRDRVDELLAREAQAEEDEWTKFHHDELAVKNELTTAILDSLILDAANVVKLAYLKKRKVPR